MANTETITKAQILEGIEFIKSQLEELQYLLERAEIPDIVLEGSDIPDRPETDGRIFRFLRCY